MTEVYDRITHAQRIQVLYLKTIHDLPLREIQELSGVKYNTIRNLLFNFRKNGLTNKRRDCNYWVAKTSKKKQLPCTRKRRRPPKAKPKASQAGDISADASPLGALGEPKSQKQGLRSGQGSMMVKDQKCKVKLFELEKIELPGQNLLVPHPKGFTLFPADHSAVQSPEGEEGGCELISSNVMSYESFHQASTTVFTGPFKVLNRLAISKAAKKTGVSALQEDEKLELEHALRPRGPVPKMNPK